MKKVDNADCYFTKDQGIAFGASASVFSPARKETPNLHMLKHTDDSDTRANIKLKEQCDECQRHFGTEGVYFFGGRQKDGTVFNKLCVLKTLQKPMQFVALQTQGDPPMGRYAHTFTALNSLGIVVVCGGRTHTHFLNDLCVLKVPTINNQLLI